MEGGGFLGVGVYLVGLGGVLNGLGARRAVQRRERHLTFSQRKLQHNWGILAIVKALLILLFVELLHNWVLLVIIKHDEYCYPLNTNTAVRFVEWNLVDLGGVLDGLGARRVVQRRERLLNVRRVRRHLCHTFGFRVQGIECRVQGLGPWS